MFLDLNVGLTGNKTHTLNHYHIELYCGDFKYRNGNFIPNFLLAIGNYVSKRTNYQEFIRLTCYQLKERGERKLTDWLSTV